MVLSDNADDIFAPAINNGVSTAFIKAVPAASIGQVFRFKVAAQNALGVGPYSAEVQLLAANSPDLPSISVDQTSRTLRSVTIKFFGNNNGGSNIIG